MTIQEWGAIGEVIGGVAVVVSLLVLAWQLHQNTKTLRTQAAYDADHGLATVNETIAANPSLASIAARCTNPGTRLEDLDETEWGQLFWLARACFQKVQGQWWLKESGMIPPAMWNERLAWMRGFIALPVIRRVWELELPQHNLVEGFVKEVESAVLDHSIGIVPPAGRSGAPGSPRSSTR